MISWAYLYALLFFASMELLEKNSNLIWKPKTSAWMFILYLVWANLKTTTAPFFFTFSKAFVIKLTEIPLSKVSKGQSHVYITTCDKLTFDSRPLSLQMQDEK